MISLPTRVADQPNRSFLEWHLDMVYRHRGQRVLAQIRRWWLSEPVSSTVVGTQGRVVLPQEILEVLDLRTGQRLSVTVRERAVVLALEDDPAAELRAFTLGPVRGRSLVDELLVERRAAASNERPGLDRATILALLSHPRRRRS